MTRVSLFLVSLAAFLLASCNPIAAPAGASQQSPPLRWGYYVADDPASLASLRQRSGDLDYVALHWAATRHDGSVEIKGSSEVIQLVRSLGARPILSVTLDGGAAAAHSFLSADDRRAAAIENLARAVAEYDGISIDFEGLYPEDRELLTRFVAQLAARLRPAGKLVTVALSAKTSDTRTGWAGAVDYAGLAPHADLFILMAYGYRTSRSSTPGSAAPMPWVESCLSFAVSQIPPRKILLGVPLYGYDWDTTTGPPARALRHPDAMAIANQQGASVQHDPVQQSAYFAYSRDGHSHEVWFEDQVTVDARVALVSRYGLGGVATWRLGHEDPGVWQAINRRLGREVTQPVQPTSTPSPGAGSNWYFAEGSTGSPFDTWLLLQNPGANPANVRLTFMLERGGTLIRDITVPPTSRTSIFANQIVPKAAFSTRIEADQPIFAERAVYAGFDGHGVTGIASPSPLWYFAEGATTPPFHTWILLQNPNPAPASVRVIFLREDGSTVIHPVAVAPNGRLSIFANQVIPDSAFSTRVESDQPIVAERAMYRFPGNATTGVTGVTSPARTWFFGGGLPTFRNVPVDTWLLMQNPNDFPVTASITLFTSEGQVTGLQRYLPPASRQSLFVNQVLSAPSFGIRVEATGEIIAERSVFMGATPFSRNEPQGAYATQGATQLGTIWALPEGSTAPPFSEKISVLNPHSDPMAVRFEFMLEGGQVTVHEATIPPTRVFDLEVGDVVRSAHASARVTTSQPSVVERTMFWAKEGKTGAHNSVGIRLQ